MSHAMAPLSMVTAHGTTEMSTHSNLADRLCVNISLNPHVSSRGDRPAVAVNNCRVRFGIQYAV
jgi:hypothetical protein